MSGAALKESVVAVVLETKSEDVNVAVSVEENIEQLEVTEADATTITATTTTTAAASNDDAVLLRELPIFNNPFIANATLNSSTASTTASLQPKPARVKAGNTSPSKSVSVLKINAPKADGDVTVMRRMDYDLVHASAMFAAAYPATSEKMIEKEEKVIIQKFGESSVVVVEKNCGNAALAGVWINLEQALELAKEYSIDKFMTPLLEAPSTPTAARRKNTKASSVASSSTTSSTITATSASVEQTGEESAETKTQDEDNKRDQTPSEESVVSEPQSQDEAAEKDTNENEETKVSEEKEEADQETLSQEESTLVAEATSSLKRARDDDDEEEEEANDVQEKERKALEHASRSAKRFRGLVAIAVGVAVAAAVPQVLPYFQ
ncbi:hypothetical protein BGZ94_009031 [Podila epigama]|nr:hypothetical protein BGZ94_009031 [Podila epigama]